MNLDQTVDGIDSIPFYGQWQTPINPGNEDGICLKPGRFTRRTYADAGTCLQRHSPEKCGDDTKKGKGSCSTHMCILSEQGRPVSSSAVAIGCGISGKQPFHRR